MSSGWIFFGIVYALYWISQGISYVVCRSGNAVGQRLCRFFWNSRIDLFQRQPFRAMGERRTVFPYSMINMIFEFGAFAAGAAAGLATTWSWRFASLEFWQALTSNLPFLGLGFVLLMMNGLVEAAGPVFFGIKGVPPLEAVRNRSYR